MTKKQVCIIDTSALCLYLDIPNMDTCAYLQKDTVKHIIDNTAYQIILPFAVVLETGNHISKIKGNKCREIAQTLKNLAQKGINGVDNWILFQTYDSDERLSAMLENWSNIRFCDALVDVAITYIANFYHSNAQNEVFILTCDTGLSAHSPNPLPPSPRLQSRRK
jgi:hypothetical protein